MIVILAAVLLQNDVILFENDPWDGFAAGSFVQLKVTRGADVQELRIDKSGGFMRVSAMVKSTGLTQTGKGVETILGVKARVEEYTADVGAMNTGRIRLSLADGIPGGVAKYVVDIEIGGQRERVRHEAKAVEKVKVGSRTVSCVRFDYERTSSASGEKVVATYWLSNEVPGLTVKARARTTVGTDVREMAVEALEFETKRK